jgi:hypothetical protein
MDIKVGDKFLVEVFGWIMCKNIDSGKYRIEIFNYNTNDNDSYKIAKFYKPKGKKLIISHFVNDLMISNNVERLNRTQIIEKI